MSTEPKVRFAQDGPVGTIIFDSAPLNQIGADFIAELLTALDAVEAAERLRVYRRLGCGGDVPLVFAT